MRCTKNAFKRVVDIECSPTCAGDMAPNTLVRQLIKKEIKNSRIEGLIVLV